MRIPSYLPPFSLFSIAVGSFMFGFGAVLTGGCMTMTLVMCGLGCILGNGLVGTAQLSLKS